MQSTFAERAAWTGRLCEPYRLGREPFDFTAYSYPAGQVVPLAVDWSYSNGAQPNWRERLLCPITGLNTRLRATVHLIDSTSGLYPNSRIYVTEQVTPLFEYLKGRFSGVAGSEYLSPTSTPGSTDDRGIRHEDLTALSFVEQSFDAVLSFECFEHIPDFKAAWKECYRVLKPGGQMLFTVPFDAALHEHTIRARLSATGTVEHLLEPEYHGDPMQTLGCLCFTRFGWQMIDDLASIGFENSRAIAVWSREFGYIGEELLFFSATRPKNA